MTSITVPLSDEQMKDLQELARRTNTSPEELARAGLTEWLRSPNKDFSEIARRVLEKNAELYRRLA